MNWIDVFQIENISNKNLGSIKILMNSGEAYSAKGTLHWYPGDEYVVLE